MNKDEQEIMVISTKKLFEENYFQNFLKQDGLNFEEIILKNFEYMKRGLAEDNPSFKQPIAYVVVVNKKLRRVFAYQRSAGTGYTETRLRGKWSWGVGGHIEKIDETSKNPILASLERELKEELDINEKIRPSVLGYINDDSNDVGKVHFGILYLVETNHEEIKLAGSEAQQCGMFTIQELEDICNSEGVIVEDWSKIALPMLKEVF
ncbi:MAG: NUDIX domain-containing protein [Candidatus Aenigmarchaeota archaeon]|nr:NUDIX domain-containing protein [Candidatus Aenigmarchaeota archaeon]